MFRYYLYTLRRFFHIPPKQLKNISKEDALKDPKWTVIEGDFYITKNYQYIKQHFVCGRVFVTGNHIVLANCIIMGGIFK